MLRDVRMFMPLVGAERIECANAENTDYRAEDVGLLEIKFNQFFRFFLDEIDCVLDVCDR